MKLNLGCGAHVVDGWVNVDYAIGARFAKLPLFRAVSRHAGLFRTDWDPRIVIHNLTSEFPWSDGSAQAVYSSHTLEHFTRDEGRVFLSRCHRVLQPRGLIRLVVPDLSRFVEHYVQGAVRADEFVDKLGVLPTNRRGRIARYLAVLVESPHKCMYDANTLLAVLRDTGFEANVREPFDSEIDGVARLELPNRVNDALIVEGRRP